MAGDLRPEGRCSHIPSVLQDQQIEISGIRVRSYPCVEQDGLIWVYFAADPKEAPGLDPPLIPISASDGRAVPRFVECQRFPAKSIMRLSD